MKISLIVTDASPLITLAVADALDVLLLPGVRVIIPDMVKYEVTRHIDKPGARALLEWIRDKEFNQVFVGSTELYEEFVLLQEINPSIKTKNRGEQAAAEILERELGHGIDAAILLFEDSDIRKANFLIRVPDNVLVMSTSTYLDGLQQKSLIASADAILEKAVAVRGEGILKREILPMSGVEDGGDAWTSGLRES